MGDAFEYWLAPLRGVTIRSFREAFARAIAEAGFCGAYAPFIPANPGIRVNDRLLADLVPYPSSGRQTLPLVPQVISRHPEAMRELLKGLRDRGFERADLNAGCPFPMIRRRGRGSGLLRTPEVLERMLAAGCEEMGEGRFSVKLRLGLDNARELRGLVPILNRYPLAVVTVHARTAKQMYEGEVDLAEFAEVAKLMTNPLMYNGDVGFDGSGFAVPESVRQAGVTRFMVGRAFVRALGAREDVDELLAEYVEISRRELCGDRPVLGRIKELVSYWREIPRWRRLWPVLKMCGSVEELRQLLV